MPHNSEGNSCRFVISLSINRVLRSNNAPVGVDVKHEETRHKR